MIEMIAVAWGAALLLVVGLCQAAARADRLDAFRAEGE
jgi:hypothetical protein